MSWSLEVRLDGEPIVTVPADEWLLAQVLAEASVALWGGPVSVIDAIAVRRAAAAAESADPTIFDALSEAVA